jgi:5'-nucleotidase / UDP-sugar diphosphatase
VIAMPRRTFPLLHTNDLHSAFLGPGARGGYARQATLIAQRRRAREPAGPVVVLCAGDYSMGTAFGAATRETGGELQLMALMGYDATTFGNHELDLGPEGLGRSIRVAARTGRCVPVVASNTLLGANDESLAELQRLTREGVIRRHIVIERGGLRFGVFGVLGKEAITVTVGAGAVAFADPIETAKELVKVLRETEKVDVVIALSHGGVTMGDDGRFGDGEDVQLARDVPGIDVVIGGHSHSVLREPILVHGRTPVVQAGKNGELLGELVLTLDGGHTFVESYQLHAIDDALAADRGIEHEIARLAQNVTEIVFASRGYRLDQPLAIAPRDLPNTFGDIAASTLLANLCTDAYREATRADIGFTVNGLLRAGLTRARSGVQTVYDVFAVAPLGAGVVDTTAGSALVTGYFTGRELEHLLEYFLVDTPSHPGEWFPRVSGMRFHYDPSRPTYDAVTAIELGNLDDGYHAIDISATNGRLYSLTCPAMLVPLVMALSRLTRGKLAVVPKNKEGRPLTSRLEALVDLPRSSAQLMVPAGTTDRQSLATRSANGALQEIKEWQAIMDHLRRLPVEHDGDLPTIPTDDRAAEVRAIALRSRPSR